MNNTLGVEFIEFFHKATIHLEAEGPRLLHVDCHASHISLPLIEFARLHNIIIIGYPPHTTHLLQGLDVVMFSPFKSAYAKRAAAHLKEKGQDVEKRDFLTVLHQAVQDSFKESNILMAWKKTGLRPVNPEVISEADLAPSQQFSTTRSLPLPPPSPIRVIIDAIHQQNALQGVTQPDSLLPQCAVTPSLPLQPIYSLEQNYDTIGVNITPSLPEEVPSPPPSADIPNGLFPSNLPDPLALLIASTASMTLNDHFTPNLPPCKPAITSGGTRAKEVSKSSATPDPGAIYVAGEILRGLASTRLAPLLELETVTSAIELPPIERGPVPHQLVKTIQRIEDVPSKELWLSVKNEFSQVVSRQERLLAQVVLQETYCQQAQRTLMIKEKPRKKSTLKTIIGMPGGFIFSGNEAHRILVADAAAKRAEDEEAEAKKDAKKLVADAKKWMEGALARQEVAHAALITNWESQPPEIRRGRRPNKPRLERTPNEYKEVLQPKKKKARKQLESDGESDCSLEEWV